MRRAAADALGKVGPAAVPALIEALRDNSSYVRWAAVAVLGEMSTTAADAVPPLIEALRGDDKDVRWAAVGALGKVGPAAADAVPALIEALVSTG